jgi:hypothetical protein
MVFVDAECPENMFQKYQIIRWPEAKMMSKTVVVPVAGQSEAAISSMDGGDAPLRGGAQGGSARQFPSLAHKNFSVCGIVQMASIGLQYVMSMTDRYQPQPEITSP